MFIYKYRPTIEHVQLFKPASLGPYDMINARGVWSKEIAVVIWARCMIGKANGAVSIAITLSNRHVEILDALTREDHERTNYFDATQWSMPVPAAGARPSVASHLPMPASARRPSPPPRPLSSLPCCCCCCVARRPGVYTTDVGCRVRPSLATTVAKS